MMQRLEALERARLIFGPTGYAEYLWLRDRITDAPACAISWGTGKHRREVVDATFEGALAQARPQDRAAS